MNNKQFSITAFTWVLGHALIYLIYHQLASNTSSIFGVLGLAAVSFYAHYRLSFHFASKFY
jgi:DMSO/TMAO reductase YedYZ heme-binding membrane subunit